MSTAMTKLNGNGGMIQTQGQGAAPIPFDVLNFESFQQAMEVCNWLSGSQFVPTAFRGKPADILLAFEYSKQLGLHPLQGIQNIAVINGRPSIWGDMLLAVVQSHPEFAGKEERTEGEGDRMVATATYRRRNRLTGEIEEAVATFSAADAHKAGLWGKSGPWQQYPKRMLVMRARTFAIRDLFADALKGVTSIEEATDIESRPGTVTVIDKPKSRPGASAFNAALSQPAQAEEAAQEAVAPNHSRDLETLQTDLVNAPTLRAFATRLERAWVELEAARGDITVLALTAIEDKVQRNGLSDGAKTSLGNMLDKWALRFEAVVPDATSTIEAIRVALQAGHEEG